MYQEEKDLIDEDEEKNKVIKEILRKQGIVSRQELRKQELENMQEQEK